MKNKLESGLIVKGKTPLDNDMIGNIVEENDFYAEWNGREGYWFFPEDEEMYDQLENILESVFILKGINARFEGVFN